MNLLFPLNATKKLTISLHTTADVCNEMDNFLWRSRETADYFTFSTCLIFKVANTTILLLE
jgi:hypothetical protein